MRRKICLGVSLIVILSLTGCDSDDPLSVNEQNVEIRMTAQGAQTLQFYVWDLFEDNNMDGVPDDNDGNGTPGEAGDTSLWCEESGGGSPRSVPWAYSLRIKTIRAGEVVSELLTSEDAQQDNFNRAPYDTPRGTHTEQNPQIDVSHASGLCNNNALITCNPNSESSACQGSGTCIPVGHCDFSPSTMCNPDNPGGTCIGIGNCIADDVTRRFVWAQTNRRLLTDADREILRATTNFLNDACNGDDCEDTVTAILGPLNPELGVCPGVDNAGDPAMDPGNPMSISSDTETAFVFETQKGDTVIVEARRGFTPPEGGIEFTAPPGLRAQVFVNGALLQADELEGESVGSAGDTSPSISFSFTSR